MNTPQVMTITYTQRVILAAQRITSEHNGKVGYDIVHTDAGQTNLIPWHYNRQGDRIHDSPLHLINDKLIGNEKLILELEDHFTKEPPLWSF